MAAVQLPEAWAPSFQARWPAAAASLLTRCMLKAHGDSGGAHFFNPLDSCEVGSSWKHDCSLHLCSFSHIKNHLTASAHFAGDLRLNPTFQVERLPLLLCHDLPCHTLCCVQFTYMPISTAPAPSTLPSAMLMRLVATQRSSLQVSGGIVIFKTLKKQKTKNSR